MINLFIKTVFLGISERKQIFFRTIEDTYMCMQACHQMFISAFENCPITIILETINMVHVYIITQKCSENESLWAMVNLSLFSIVPVDKKLHIPIPAEMGK